jgi:hypothetical protein
MSTLAIFLYGLVVTALVVAALALVAWGIATERRDRKDPRERRKVFGEPAAATIEAREERGEPS